MDTNKLSECIIAAKKANETYKMPFDILERLDNNPDMDRFVYVPFGTVAAGYQLAAKVESNGMITIF
jgi:hypothetical protein